jgi:putative membrane protein
VSTWSPDPSIVIGCGLLAALYLACLGPWRRRFRSAERVCFWRVASFLSGVAVIFLALGTPIDTLSDGYLLSVHMVQHLLLTLVMPVLLLIGTPGWLLRPLLRSWLVARLARWCTRPLVAFALFNVPLAVSHWPVFYNQALVDHRLHIVQHLLYMVTATITWWPVLGSLPELPRLAYPLQMLYLFVQTLPGGLVGAMIALSSSVLYPVYAAAPRVSSLSALADQQLGGLIMWLGAPTIIFVAMTCVFFTWAGREEVRALPASSA